MKAVGEPAEGCRVAGFGRRQKLGTVVRKLTLEATEHFREEAVRHVGGDDLEFLWIEAVERTVGCLGRAGGYPVLSRCCSVAARVSRSCANLSSLVRQVCIPAQ